MNSVEERLLDSKLVKIEYVEERFSWNYSDLLFRINTQGKLIITEVSMRDHKGRIKIYDLDPQIDAVKFDLRMTSLIPRVIEDRHDYDMVIILREDATISLLMIVAVDNQEGQERVRRMTGNLESILFSDNYRYYLLSKMASNIVDLAVNESVLLLDQDKLVHRLDYQMNDNVTSPVTLVSDPEDPIEQILPDTLVSHRYLYLGPNFTEKIDRPDNLRFINEYIHEIDGQLVFNVDAVTNWNFTLKTVEGSLDSRSIKKMLGWNGSILDGQDDGQDCQVLDNQGNLWFFGYPSLRLELCSDNVIDVNNYRFNLCYIDTANNLHVMDDTDEVFSIPDAGLLRGTHYGERANWTRKRTVTSQSVDC